MSTTGAPAGVYCDGETPGFRGDSKLDLRSAPIGSLLCYRTRSETPVIEWRLEPLLLMGRVTGPDPTQLSGWWNDYYGSGPPTSELVAAINKQADPDFPSPPERALLRHVPTPSSVDCMRTPRSQIERNVKSTPVAAVVCGPTPGAGIVFYYQFDDSAALRDDYRRNTDISGPDCTKRPKDFVGDAPYKRGGTTGRLACGMSPNGNPYLIWTDDRRKIIVFAFSGTNRTSLVDWWRSGAGPI